MPSVASIDIEAVETWVFDLDNTLYPARCNLFAEINLRMHDFICRTLEVASEEASAIRQRFYTTYGTTMRGLMVEHDIDPAPFLDFVHDIDLSPLSVDDKLDKALSALPGRKLIYTNATTAHAERVSEKIGIARHFDGIFDIIAADYLPKPHKPAYQAFIEKFDFDPQRAVMVEDMDVNLKPAAELGMKTVLLPGHNPREEDWTAGDHIHHEIEHLADWLYRHTHG